MLECRGLVKRYGTLTAVDGVSFTVRAGESVGLLGPNGAVKTTTLSMVVGLLKPDAGAVTLLGQPLGGDTDPRKAKLGFVPQELALYEELSALDNLRFFGALYGLAGAKLDEACKKALGFVGLGDRARDRPAGFSGGMKRRLNLAAALLHDPELVIFDEPTVGVDPQSRNFIFDNLEALRKAGKTIVYTTHYMEEVERLCERVVIVDHGKVIADDTLSALLGRATVNKIRVELEAPFTGTLTGDAISTVESDGARLTVTTKDAVRALPQVLSALERAGRRWRHVELDRPNLESVFLQLTGRTLRDK